MTVQTPLLLTASKQHFHPTQSTQSHLKYLSLIILVLQTSSIALILRHTRRQQVEYQASTAVFLTEVVKLVVSAIALCIQQRTFFPKSMIDSLLHRDALRMLLPAALYAVQNNLLFIALSNLDSVTFQVLNQTKIITTAFFAWVLLDKRLSAWQGVALAMLTAGVVLVQLGPRGEVGPAAGNRMLGLVVILLAAASSGFASCYFEKTMKSPNTSMWIRNIQLALFSGFFSFALMVMKAGDEISSNGLLSGYTGWVWVVVFNQAIGGICVSLVLKYADSILKSFATSLSIIVSSVISMVWFDFIPSLPFCTGSALVLAAVFLYSSQ